MLVLGAINWFGNRSHDLTIPSKIRAVQDRIHSLMNHALKSDHSTGSVRVQPAESSRVRSRPSTITLLPQGIAM